MPRIAHKVVQRLQFLVERARGHTRPPFHLPFFNDLNGNRANRHFLEIGGKLVEANDAPPAGGFLHIGSDGFKPEGNEFLELDVALLVAVEPVTLLPKLGKASPGQSFIRCFEGTLYLLAVNGKPSEKSAVTVSVEAFADFSAVRNLM